MKAPSGWKRTLAYAVLVSVAIVYLYPFVIQIATSFKTDVEASNNPLGLVANPFSLAAWQRMFGLTEDSSVPFSSWLGNSVLITVIVTAARVFFDSLAGQRGVDVDQFADYWLIATDPRDLRRIEI